MSTDKTEDDGRLEYRREELGRGVRGKYYAKQSRGTNLVLLDAKLAKAFPNSEAVNKALTGVLNLMRQTTWVPKRSGGRTKAHR